jgi:hypothetical protein
MTNEQLIKAYERVIDDLSNDIGYEPGVQEQTIGVLENRVRELEEEWNN